MNRTVGPQQQIRGLPGFSNQQPQPQQPQPNRNIQMGSGRIQTGKIGSNPSWGFNMHNGPAGIQNTQSRGPGANTSFAQTIGGNPSAGSLDLSEFPSLSNGPQPQYQNPSQAVWTGQRAALQTPVQRPQPSLTPVNNPPSHLRPSTQASDPMEESFFNSSAVGDSMGDFRHGGQGGVGQLSGSSQPQTGNIDDFPPLGRTDTGSVGPDRRVAMIQNAANGTYSNAPGFPAASRVGEGRVSGDTLQQGQGNGDQENLVARALQNGENAPFSNTNGQPRGTSRQPEESSRTSQQPDRSLSSGQMENPAGIIGVPNQSKSPGKMNDMDRWGLPGLFETIRNENSDAGSLAIGQDLTSLGLDLNSSEPLWPSFGGPFSSQPARPMLPEFQLPACYTVKNTHDLEEKIPSLHEDTLCFIFYTMVKEVYQELAAVELTHRGWRYHKILQIWITKDRDYPDPHPLSPDAERGRYIVFNPKTWQRESREMIIYWADLDDHISTSIPNTMISQTL